MSKPGVASTAPVAMCDTKGRVLAESPRPQVFFLAGAFGLARQYEMITEGKVLSHVHVFQDENAALEWLNSSSMNA